MWRFLDQHFPLRSHIGLYWHYRNADRRDAKLMLELGETTAMWFSYEINFDRLGCGVISRIWACQGLPSYEERKASGEDWW